MNLRMSDLNWNDMNGKSYKLNLRFSFCVSTLFNMLWIVCVSLCMINTYLKIMFAFVWILFFFYCYSTWGCGFLIFWLIFAHVSLKDLPDRGVSSCFCTGVCQIEKLISLLHVPRSDNWWIMCQKQVSGDRTSNYISQCLRDIITCLRPWYLLMAQYSSIKINVIININLNVPKCWEVNIKT